MRKLFSFLMLAMMFAFASCMKEEVDLGSGSEETIRFSVNLPQQGALSRTAFSDPALTNPMRVFLYVMYEGSVVEEQKIESHVFNTSDGGVNPATFDLRLVTGKDYTVAVWADFGDEYYTVSTEKVVADEKTIPTVEMVTDEGKITGSKNARDAYFAVETVNFNSANESKSMTLKRPFGLVRIQTLDYEEDAVVNADLLPTAYEMTVAATQTKINLFNGELMGDDNSLTISGEVTDVAATGELSFDYFFAPAEQEGNAEEQQGKLHNFTVKYTKDANEIVSYEFTNIPVRRNYKTNISGNILTKKGTISVTVEQDWVGSINESLEVAPGDLQTVLDGLSVTELIDANIVVTGKLPIDASYTLPAVVEGSSISIVLAGAEGNVIFRSADFKGSLNVSNTGDAIDLTVNVPAGDAVIGSGNWSSLTVTTKENTCVIEEGTTVETLIVNGGNVKIYGDVNTIQNNGEKSKITWAVGNKEKLAKVVQMKENCDTLLLTANIDGLTDMDEDGACVRIIKEGIVFDGNGFAISGNAKQNVMVITANRVEVKDLEIYQPEGGNGSNGITVYNVADVKITGVTIHDCKKAAMIINGANVVATGMHTYANGWGGVNVDRGSGVDNTPMFTFDETCDFEETFKIWVDCAKPWTVNAPEGWVEIETVGKVVFMKLEGNGSEQNPFQIANKEDLLLFGKLVNTENDFKNKIFVLMDDIDMSGVNWEPAGNVVNTVFKGVFDGQGHTISNLTINNYQDTDEPTRQYAGLFYTFNGTLKNLNVNNANIHGIRSSVLVGRMDGGIIDNCHVSDAKIKGVQKNGVIAGFINSGDSDIEITNCSAKNCEFTSAYDGVYWQTGAISGYMSVGKRNVLIANNDVDNITITGTEKNEDVYYMEQLYSHPFIGNIVNMSTVEDAFEKYTIELKNNHISNSTHNDLQTCDRTNEFFGWYAGDCNGEGYFYSVKVVVDGVVCNRYVEIERLASEIAKGGSVTLHRNYDLTHWGKSFVVDEGSETVLDLAKYSISGRCSIIENNGKLTIRSSKGIGKIATTAVLKGKTAIKNNAGAELNFESGTVSAKVFALLNKGVANIKGGILESFSKNSDVDEETGEKTWAYCVRTEDGGTMNFTGGTIKGIQGGLACQGENSKITISDKANIEVRHSAPGKNDCFYALYTSWESVIEVLGGTFYSDRVPCAYASDEDQAGTPYGSFVLKGGKYSSMPKNQEGNDWPAEEGYKFVETGDATYPYEIVKE